MAQEERERQKLEIEAQTGTTEPLAGPEFGVLAPAFETVRDARTGGRDTRTAPRAPQQGVRLPPSVSSAWDQAPRPLAPARDLDGDGYADTPAIYAAAPAAPTALQSLFAARAGQDLPLFGYDIFTRPDDDITLRRRPEGNWQEAEESRAREVASQITPMGAVADDVVLRSGDKLEVVFSGQRRDRDVHRINAQGLLLVPDFPPIPAAGRTLGDLRAAIETETANLRNTQVHVSLFSVRQISVFVTGHVRAPGKQRVSAFQTALDALIEAGGVEPTGSLRAITLVRGGQRARLDLYALLTDLESAGAGAVAPDIPLQDGDRIIVPPLGPTVAVAGDVGRPGIYELAPGGGALTLDDMLRLGGGVLAPGANRFMRLTPTEGGRDVLEPIAPKTDGNKPKFSAGAILMVARATGAPAGQVRLSGHTRQPGLHVLARAGKLSTLLSGPEVLGPDVYPLAAVLERRDAKQMAPSWRVFSPRAVLDRTFDTKLEQGDIVHLFSRAQVIALADGRAAPGLTTQLAPPVCTPGPDGALIGQSCTQSNEPDNGLIADPNIRALLRENAVFVRGGVRTPGPWPLAGPTRLTEVVAVAGGLTRAADPGDVEITRLPAQDAGPMAEPTVRDRVDFATDGGKAAQVAPGDAVQIGQKRDVLAAGDTVWIGGEVRRPGTYGLTPGETLAGLIERAGGVTEQAYPAGAVFSRAQARKAEEARYRAAAMDIEHAIALARERTEDGKVAAGPSDEKILMARALADELRSVKGLGRVVVEARPEVLATQRELDVVLTAGDRLYIPPRPASVRVAGEVMSPGFMPFRTGKTPRDYIDDAAGPTYFGDRARSFILYPDGRAQRLSTSGWNHKPILVPPGSTIVVPRDPKPFDFLATTRDISTILANLAIAVIFIDDVVND